MTYTGRFDATLAERYRARFHAEPLWTVAKAYDNVLILKGAIEQCGSQPGQIRDCLAKTDFRGASGRVRFSPQGVIEAFEPITELRRIESAKIVKIE